MRCSTKGAIVRAMEKLIENAIEKLEKLGKPVGGLAGPPKTYSGLGSTKTAGRRKIPWGTLLSNAEHIGGSLTSNEMMDSPNLPLLLSLGAQSTLGLQKDTRKGACYIPDMGAFVKLYEVVGSELRAICISEFYDVPGPATPAAMEPEDVPAPMSGLALVWCSYKGIEPPLGRLLMLQLRRHCFELLDRNLVLGNTTNGIFMHDVGFSCQSKKRGRGE